ncbi:hypothetical protein CEXT_282821 [Caerostris extrusa]|uniref:Uncharacterized protein n=1 Tax=Caerostris extrusa TaxID=172846 RepID=A0AAV4XL33_CAEEX|nr:hypothetical protein CEXT_282821 [Caerostris extrusa]
MHKRISGQKRVNRSEPDSEKRHQRNVRPLFGCMGTSLDCVLCHPEDLVQTLDNNDNHRKQEPQTDVMRFYPKQTLWPSFQRKEFSMR